MAPVQLSEVITKAKGGPWWKGVRTGIIVAQLVLLVPFGLLLPVFPGQAGVLVMGGAVAGFFILIVPPFYREPLSSLRARRPTMDARHRVVLFWRGVGRFAMFFMAGAIALTVLIGPPWYSLHLVAALELGYLTSAVVDLMLVMGHRDEEPETPPHQLLSAAVARRRVLLRVLVLVGLVLGLAGLFAWFAEDEVGLRIVASDLSAFAQGRLTWPQARASILPSYDQGEAFSAALMLALTSLGAALGVVAPPGRLAALAIYRVARRHRWAVAYDELGFLGSAVVDRLLQQLQDHGDWVDWLGATADLLEWCAHRPVVVNALIRGLRVDTMVVVTTWLQQDPIRASAVGRGLMDGDATLPAWVFALARFAQEPTEERTLELVRQLRATSSALPAELQWVQTLDPARHEDMDDWRASCGRWLPAWTDSNGDRWGAQLDAALANIVVQDATQAFHRRQERGLGMELDQDVATIIDDRFQVRVHLRNSARAPLTLHRASAWWRKDEQELPLKLRGEHLELKRELQVDEATTLTFEGGNTLAMGEGRLVVQVTESLPGEGGHHGAPRVRVLSAPLLLRLVREFRPIPLGRFTRLAVRSEAELVGRDALLNELAALLARPEEHGFVLVSGERRIGKTSILNVLCERLRAQGTRVGLVDGQALYSQHLQDDQDLLGVVRGPLVDPLAPEEHPRGVLCIDEFDALWASLGEAARRFLLSRPFDASGLTVVVAAPASALATLPMEVRNVLAGQRHYPIEPLAAEVVSGWVQRFLGDLVDFAPGAVQRICELCGGYPIYVQALCGTLAMELNARASTSVVTTAFIEEALARSGESIGGLMSGLLETLGPQELEFVKRLANGGGRWSLAAGQAEPHMVARLVSLGIVERRAGQGLVARSELLIRQENLDRVAMIRSPTT